MDAVFSDSEYRERLQNVRDAMRTAGIELLLVSDPCNIYYLTGYDGWTFYTPQLLIVSMEEPPVWVGRRMDEQGVRVLTNLPDDSIVAYGDHLVQNDSSHPFEVVASAIRERYSQVRRIGLEEQNYYLTVQAAGVLHKQVAGAEFVDASLLVNWVRFVKSRAEIALLKQAGELLDRSMAAAMEIADVGIRECDVAAEIYAANCRGTADYGGVYTSSPAFLCAGDRMPMPHLCWSDRRIEPGTGLNLELMGNRLRYQVTMGRTMYFGKVPLKLARLAGIVVEGIERTMEAVRPGVSCEDVEAVWRSHIARHGMAKESRCGYPLGIAFPPTGGEMTASIRPGDATELREGVAMHFLPAIWDESASLCISEPFVVTASGCDRLTSTPRKLFAKPAHRQVGGQSVAS